MQRPKSLTEIRNRLATIARQGIVKASIRAGVKGMVSHSHDHIAAQLIKYAQDKPDCHTKQRMLTIAQEIPNMKDLCWPDILDYFDYVIPNEEGGQGWWPDDELLDWILAAFPVTSFKPMRLAIRKWIAPRYPHRRDNYDN